MKKCGDRNKQVKYNFRKCFIFRLYKYNVVSALKMIDLCYTNYYNIYFLRNRNFYCTHLYFKLAEFHAYAFFIAKDRREKDDQNCLLRHNLVK